MYYTSSSQGLLAPIEPWLMDPEVSEILVNRPKVIYVEKHGAMQRYDLPAWDEHTLELLFQLIANENQQILTTEKPIMSGTLKDGSRVQIVLAPTAVFPTLSIRRQVVSNFNLDDYKKNNFYQITSASSLQSNFYMGLSTSEKELHCLYQNKNWDKFIRRAIELKKNIIISGGTSSGKTTFLNACLAHISLDERIILLEDTREINIPHDNFVSLLAVKGEQGVAKVSLQDLVQCALRLRPDRIICGEIRGKEILDFIAACSTGHEGAMTTIHANNPQIAFMRMMHLYKLNNVPSMRDEDIMRELKEVIDVIIQLTKTKTGRKVQSIYYKYGDLKNVA